MEYDGRFEGGPPRLTVTCRIIEPIRYWDCCMGGCRGVTRIFAVCGLVKVLGTFDFVYSGDIKAVLGVLKAEELSEGLTFFTV